MFKELPSPTDDGRSLAREDIPDTGGGEAVLLTLSYYPLTGDRPPTPPPRQDPDCDRCKIPVTLAYYFDPTLAIKKYFQLGEVLQIRESAHTPIDRLFARIVETTGVSSSKGSVSSARFYQDLDRHPRPGVVMELRRIKLSREKTYTCIRATDLNIHTDTRLPPVLQHFWIPVSPHCEVGKGVAHLHTSPEWQRRHVWLITHAFFSSGDVLGRWEWRDKIYTRTPDQSFMIDPDMMGQLWEIEQQKWKAWEERATDNKYLLARYNEYQVSC